MISNNKQVEIMHNGDHTGYYIQPDGKIWSIKTNKYLKGGYDEDGYHICKLSLGKRDKYIIVKFHREVAKAFVKVPKRFKNIDLSNLEVNHKDGDKQNNHYSNLEWCRPVDNTHHAMKIKLRNSVIDEKIAKKICKELSKGRSPKYISDKFSIPRSTIIKIKNNLNWKEISKDFNLNDLYLSRGLKGEENVNSKITEKLAKKIKKDLSKNISPTDISKKYGINRSIVYHIKYGKTWKDI